MLLVLLAILTCLLIIVLLKSNKSHEFWRERGIAFVEPLPVIGSSLKTILLQQSQGGLYYDVYNKNPDKPYIGFFELTQPILLIRDPSFVSKIFIKDFSHFVDRDLPDGGDDSEVDSGLFFLRGDEWRAVRYKMVPGFTTGRLRHMFPQILACANRLKSIIDNCGRHVDIAHVSTPFTMSVIGSCVFGIDIETNEESKFRQMGQKFFEMPFTRYLQFLTFMIFPKIAKKLNFNFTPKDVGRYFARIIKDTFKYRQENNIVKNDFVQTLIQLKEQGVVDIQSRETDDDYLYTSEITPSVKNIEMTEKLIVSQAFTFITAGFEVLNVTIMYTLFELSQNTDTQARAREEIDNLIEKHGELTYNAIREAKFLSYCVDEAVRLHPLVPNLFRVCTKRYEIEPDKYIDPGTRIGISVTGLHHDPSLWRNPQTFDPDRWERDPITPSSYIPFGDGPRMCIGMRFALLELKIALAVILHNYRVTLSPITKLPLKEQVRSILTKPQQIVYFNFEKILR